MGKRKQRQPGPQRHAEGQHGEKTHRRFVEQLQESAPKTAEAPEDVLAHARIPHEGDSN